MAAMLSTCVLASRTQDLDKAAVRGQPMTSRLPEGTGRKGGGGSRGGAGSGGIMRHHGPSDHYPRCLPWMRPRRGNVEREKTEAI